MYWPGWSWPLAVVGPVAAPRMFWAIPAHEDAAANIAIAASSRRPANFSLSVFLPSFLPSFSPSLLVDEPHSLLTPCWGAIERHFSPTGTESTAAQAPVRQIFVVSVSIRFLVLAPVCSFQSHSPLSA